MDVTAMLGGAWLFFVTYLYFTSAANVLMSQGFISARPAAGTIQAVASLTLVGVMVGLIGGRVLIRTYVFALLGFGLVTVGAMGLAGHMLAFAVTTWIVLVAWAGGDRLMKWALGRSAAVPIGQRAVISVTVGLGVLSQVVLGLGLLGYVSPAIYAGLLILVTVVCYREFLDLWRILRQHGATMQIGSVPPRAPWFWLGLFSLAAGWLFVVMVEAVAPEVMYDSLYYHLAIPKIYLADGQIAPIRYLTPSYFYLGTEMLYLLGMGVANQTVAKLINVVFFVILVAAVVSIGRREFTLRAGIYGAVLTMTAPLFAWEASTTYVDLPLAVYCFLASAATYSWWRTSHARWLLVAGSLCGFALSAKLTAVLSIVPIIVLIGLVIAWRSRLRVWLGWREIALFSVGFIVMGAQWPLIQYSWTGNPVFPMFNGVFQSPYVAGMAGIQPGEFDNDVIERAIAANDLGTGTSIGSLLRLPWALTFDSSRFMENSPSTTLGLGLVCLPLLVLTGRMRRSAVVASMIFVLLCGVLWAFSGQAIRYGMSQLVLVNLLAGFALAESHRVWGTYAGRVIFRSTVAALVLVWGVFNLPLYLSLFWNLPERVPYSVAFGRERTDAYISRHLPVVDAYHFIKADAGAAEPRTLTVGEQGARLYAPGVLVMHQSLQSWPALMARDPAEVMNGLLSLGVTYLVVDAVGPVPFMSDRIATKEWFLDANLELLYAHRNIEVYRVPAPGTVSLPTERRDLMFDGSFEIEDSTTGWRKTGEPMLDRSGSGSRTGRAAARVSGQNHFFQHVEGITAGKLYELRMATREAVPESQVRFQMIWTDPDGQTVGMSVNPLEVGSEWSERRMLTTAPAGATGAIVFAISQVGEVWVDDVALNELQPAAVTRD